MEIKLKFFSWFPRGGAGTIFFFQVRTFFLLLIFMCTRITVKGSVKSCLHLQGCSAPHLTTFPPIHHVICFLYPFSSCWTFSEGVGGSDRSIFTNFFRIGVISIDPSNCHFFLLIGW